MERTKKLGAMVIAGTLALMPSVFGKASNAPATLDQQVFHKLASLPYYTVFDDIQFRVDGSTVVLFGQVTQPVMKLDAERSVREIEGVNVRDEIEVLPLSPMDSRIRRATYAAIYGYGPLQHYAVGLQNPIHIIVKNGDVELIGRVQNQMDSQMAEMRANSVSGVFAVKNDLAVAR
jgi:hyperosmotically inducible protein